LRKTSGKGNNPLSENRGIKYGIRKETKSVDGNGGNSAKEKETENSVSLSEGCAYTPVMVEYGC